MTPPGQMNWYFWIFPQQRKGMKRLVNVVEQVAAQIHMPLTVGGGIRTIQDMRQLLLAGADKISINSAAVANPLIIKTRCRIVWQSMYRTGR